MPTVKTSDQHVKRSIHIPSTSCTTDLEVVVNEALHRTGQGISKRNIIKPPQIRGSKKMGPFKTRLSLKESINRMLDWRERMREGDKTRRTKREI